MNKSLTQNILDQFEKNQDVALPQIPSGAISLIISDIYRKQQRPLLIITKNDDASKEIFEDLRFYSTPQSEIRILPDLAVIPFSRISPEPDEVSERIDTLSSILRKENRITIASVSSLLRRAPPKSFIESNSFFIRKEQNIELDGLTNQLVEIGYEETGLVEDKGTFAKRGGILDIWSPSMDAPARLELDIDKVLSIKPFNPATQRSKRSDIELIEASIIPAREFMMDEASRNKAAHRIRHRSSVLSSSERKTLIEMIHEGIAFSGIETLMPLFHEETATVFSYFGKDLIVAINDEIAVDNAASLIEKEIEELREESKSSERIIETDEIVLKKKDLEDELSNYKKIIIDPLPHRNGELIQHDIRTNGDIKTLLSSHKEGEDILTPLANHLKELQKDNWQILITCHTNIQAQRLGELFHIHDIDLMEFSAPFDTLVDMTSKIVKLKIGRLSSGFQWPQNKLAIITDEEIFGDKIKRRIKSTRPMEAFTSLSELLEDDYIVHEQHGIGRYLGLKHLVLEGKQSDFMVLEYLGNDKLYIPAYKLNLVGKYIGAANRPPQLDKLGGIRWRNIKESVKKDIRAMAGELLKTFAKRKIHKGHAFQDLGAEYEEFCATFPFDETPDQAKAIEDVMNDMGDSKPSDRLICGDVGYGKTEVAMRATFRCALSGKQAAILVPTTVLAFQHYESFIKRFIDSPIRIEMLSRFKSLKERKEIVEDLRKGKIDIIIGTHRLLQKDISFKDLGLLIIDEEHRFGVKHKENIKKLKSSVDVITMTATPIPRTLNLSLTGIRDISIINTPPIDRQSVATYVCEFDEGIIRHAILREISRGGQVFFVHNRVETISSMYNRLTTAIPEAKIVVGHGKLKEKNLEKVMIDFLTGEADVLLCTTIIESGLDIPNANTIIIHRADTFGLAQLYQLRGRVGRSSVKAHAYLLTPNDREITTQSKKRLAVLKRYTELGSGFQIAMHDLEFRGAGNILGSAQSGHINAIGYELYTKLLDKTIRSLKGEKTEEEIDPELNLRVEAFIPEDFIRDQSIRVSTYKKIAGCEKVEELEAIEVELSDRFGPPPIQAINLLKLMEIKFLAQYLHIKQLAFDGTHLSCQLAATSPLENTIITDLLTQEHSKYRIVPPDRLLIRTAGAQSDSEVLASTKNSLRHLLSYVTQSD